LMHNDIDCVSLENMGLVNLFKTDGVDGGLGSGDDEIVEVGLVTFLFAQGLTACGGGNDDEPSTENEEEEEA
jgi:hypothetical protein